MLHRFALLLLVFGVWLIIHGRLMEIQFHREWSEAQALVGYWQYWAAGAGLICLGASVFYFVPRR